MTTLCSPMQSSHTVSLSGIRVCTLLEQRFNRSCIPPLCGIDEWYI